jgi:hypothetical protein
MRHLCNLPVVSRLNQCTIPLMPCTVKRNYFIVAIFLFFVLGNRPILGQTGYESLKADFSNLPLEKRQSMPLLWLHGEDGATLKENVNRIIAGGNGGLVIESRPHPDWMGQKWFDDCKVIADYAKSKGIKCWIFDEKWWPSFMVDGKVPMEHYPKKLECTAMDLIGPKKYKSSGYSGTRQIKTIAGKIANGIVEVNTLVDGMCPREHGR